MRKRVATFLLAAVLLLLVVVPGAWSQSATRSSTTGPVIDEPFDLQALIKAAQAEGELVVYHTSSRVTVAGDNFLKKYGIKVKGTKMASPEQTERVVREVDSGNVQVDCIGYEDGPLLEAKLLPEGYVISYLPGDMKNVISKPDQFPLVDRWQPRVFCYNFESYPAGAPVKNIWELTEPQWKGKIIIPDPALVPATLAFFSTIVNQPQTLEKAYKDKYGKALKLTEKNAGWEFLKMLFKNDIIATKSDGDAGDAVGSAGQKGAPIGLMTVTKLRDNETKNLKLATLQGMQPFMGYALPTYALIVKNAPHPNAAKLWIHYMLTEEGIAPWTTVDLGAYSSNPGVSYHPGNEGSWATWLPKLLRLENKSAMTMRQDILDFWLQYGAQ